MTSTARLAKQVPDKEAACARAFTSPGTSPDQVIRRKQFRQPIARFNEEGHATPAFYEEQARAPIASDATCRISGVSRDVAPGAVGKLCLASAFSSFMFRRPGQLETIMKMQQVKRVPLSARVYRECNGRGKEFYRVRYDLVDKSGLRQRKAIYLGYDPELAAWARDILRERRWMRNQRTPHVLDADRIKSLRDARRQGWALAQEIVAHTDFYFHGCRLRERRK